MIDEAIWFTFLLFFFFEDPQNWFSILFFVYTARSALANE